MVKTAFRAVGFGITALVFVPCGGIASSAYGEDANPTSELRLIENLPEIKLVDKYKVDYTPVTKESIFREVEDISDELAELESQGEISQTLALGAYTALGVIAVGVANNLFLAHFYPRTNDWPRIIPLRRANSAYIRAVVSGIVTYILPAAISGGVNALIARSGSLPIIQSHEFGRVFMAEEAFMLAPVTLSLLYTYLKNGALPDHVPAGLSPQLGMPINIFLGSAMLAAYNLVYTRFQRGYTYHQLKLKLHSLNRQFKSLEASEL
ncbi:hypothetical protein [Parendozoicomonas sp. Alg238-R29]|uniref:hypothetical protein n=1 Tax=Parendozoicomonas sp. Alg238-R29 TaxID=2993446 RepID=UPI00248E1EC0|nr:hypothetical protein [Parendozoicomonas sp. Alg238-R29]